MAVSEQLRQAIHDSGLTHYRIAHDTAISATTIDRFMAGKTLRTDTLDPLCEYFGLQLRQKRGTSAAKEAAKKGRTTAKE